MIRSCVLAAFYYVRKLGDSVAEGLIRTLKGNPDLLKGIEKDPRP